MKSLSIILVILLLLSSSTIFAKSSKTAELKREQIADNLKIGLESQNEGLRISSAYMLTDLMGKNVVEQSDASGSLIPLMKMLNNGQTEIERITAAMALYELGNSIGIRALRNAAIFDESQRVRKHAKDFYIEYHLENKTPYLIDF